MTCTKSGCKNIQCYVCSKSCTYEHFDDTSRGGTKGNCPLFDSVEVRHQEEVQAAEELARKRVAELNPGIDVRLLEINLSDRVKEDEQRRRKGVVRAANQVRLDRLARAHRGTLLATIPSG